MITIFGIISILFFTSGIVSGYFFKVDTSLSFWFFILITVLEVLALIANKNSFIKGIFPILIFIFSFVYTDLYYRIPLPKDHISNFVNDGKYIVEGYLYKPIERSQERMRLYIETLKLVDQGKENWVSGKIRINIRLNEDKIDSPINLHYGDLVKIEAKLYKASNYKNPGGIDYAGYLARHKIYVVGSSSGLEKIIKIGEDYGNFIVSSLFGIREKILAICKEDMDLVSFQIFASTVFGDYSYLTPLVSEKFTALGIVHVISVSGLHVGFIALVFYGLFKEFFLWSGYINRYKHAGRYCSLLTILPVIAYSIMCGMRIPTLRSMIMLVIFLMGKAFYRNRNAAKSVAFAWVIMLLLDPSSIVDAGCQLSFIAVTTLLYAYHFVLKHDLLQKFPYIHPKILFYFVGVFFVYLTTMPIILYHFKRISLLGVFGNIIFVPVFGIIISIGILNGILIILNIPICHWINYLISTSLDVIFYLVDKIASVTFCQAFFPLSTFAPIIFYYLLLFSPFFLKKKRILFYIIVSTFLFFSLLLNFPLFRGNKLKVTFLDLGNGTSVHASLPSGEDYLIDCGSLSKVDVGRFIMAPYFQHLGVTEFDKIIISHTHQDHLSGMPYILSYYPVEKVILGTPPFENPL
ncbi:ComEC/Rec2 family competence protein, partial [bacterium]|nr:ComEC/Rec2 family competence protein [bacterium]